MGSRSQEEKNGTSHVRKRIEGERTERKWEDAAVVESVFYAVVSAVPG